MFFYLSVAEGHGKDRWALTCAPLTCDVLDKWPAPLPKQKTDVRIFFLYFLLLVAAVLLLKTSCIKLMISSCCSINRQSCPCLESIKYVCHLGNVSDKSAVHQWKNNKNPSRISNRSSLVICIQWSPEHWCACTVHVLVFPCGWGQCHTDH